LERNGDNVHERARRRRCHDAELANWFVVKGQVTKLGVDVSVHGERQLLTCG
jgi:hypothetical protein